MEVIQAGYYEARDVITEDRAVVLHRLNKIAVSGFSQTDVNDENNATCTHTSVDNSQLQAVFYFSYINPEQTISTEVVLKNVEDCRSPAWTWFVQSRCNGTIYSECSRVQIKRNSVFTHCLVTCHCCDSCGYLYFKHYQIPRWDQSSERLCEIWAL